MRASVYQRGWVIDYQQEREWAPIENRSIKLSKQMLPNIVQEQRKARGPMAVRGLYSLKLKAVPHPKLME